MNCIAVIACLGLLCGTLFASDAKSNKSTIGATGNPNSTQCLQNSTAGDCNNGVDSVPEVSQSSTDITPVREVVDSDNTTHKSNNNPTSESKDNFSKNRLAPNNDGKSINAPSTNASDDSTDVPPPTTTTATTTAATTSTTESTSTSSTTTTATTTTTTTPTTTTSPTTTVATTTTVPVTTPTPTQPTLSPNTSTTYAPVTTEIPPTAKPANDRQFDGPSFIGGIVFALGVTAIAFVAWKFYKARTERNYHTL